MIRWIKQLDELLQGQSTRQSELKEGRLNIPVGGLSVLIIVLGAISGLCIGSFSLFRALWTDSGTMQDAAMQMFASAVKVPLLFFLTLVVTFPSLYVFSSLAGSRLSVTSVARLLVAMLGVMLAVLSSLGPIIVFFGASTESYGFIKLLNVVAASIAGMLGLAFLLRTLHRLMSWSWPHWKPRERDESQEVSIPPQTENTSDASRTPTEMVIEEREFGPLEHSGMTSARARTVFRIWVFVFAIVGAQMSWVLRPFIGSPDLPFSWFRSRQSNFFLDVVETLGNLLRGV